MREKLPEIKKFLALYVCLPIVLDLIIECLNRKSIVLAFRYMLEKPSLFLFNVLIVMLTVSVAKFFKREIFVLSMISIIWLLFGVANYVILHFRVTPFSAVDFTLISSAISVSGHYLSPLNIAMIIVAAVMLVVAVVCLFRKAPCYQQNVSRRAYIISGLIVVVLVGSIFWIRSSSASVQALVNNYTNISEAYENYGFVYCFANSLLDTGISEPEDYGEEKVLALKDSLVEEKNQTALPNIVMLQLESFFDITAVKELRFSSDPIPNFHRLQRECSDGLLTVPTVGAGTVNTEFEVLTGMSQHDFGVSEYPYKTVLKSTPSESICQDLAGLGYTSHCIHNNTATFYGRNKVFANLGFNTFTSVEYMNDVSMNPNGWAKDNVLKNEVLKTLDSTRKPDLIFGITVQSHGKYDGIELEEKTHVTVSGAPEGKEDAYQYYVHELYEVDQMIGELVAELEQRQEPTVLVLYGDHLPSLNLTDEDLEGDRNLYQTEYVIWNNYFDGAVHDQEDQDLMAYQLYATVLDQVGIHEGIITRYHQQKDWDREEYQEGLVTLAYDLLYGENYVYQGENPFKASVLRMGTEEITLTDVVEESEGLILQGSGFTPYCHVLFQGEEVESQWLDSSRILLTGDVLIQEESPLMTYGKKKGDVFVVQVQTGDGVQLSESTPLRLKNTSFAKK